LFRPSSSEKTPSVGNRHGMGFAQTTNMHFKIEKWFWSPSSLEPFILNIQK
jgi:hypothetical protein